MAKTWLYSNLATEINKLVATWRGGGGQRQRTRAARCENKRRISAKRRSGAAYRKSGAKTMKIFVPFGY
jgi:hypothetical protein